MKAKRYLATAAVVVFPIFSLPSYALDFFTDRASWEAALQQHVAAVNIATQVPNEQTLPTGSAIVLPYDEKVTFNLPLQGLQVPTSWASWSNGETPAVLFTQYNGSPLTGTFGPQPVIAFGLEIEPNLFAVFNIALATTDGGTHTLTQSVNGYAGAKFFGWIGEVSSMQITCSSGCNGEGFAIGNLAIGGFAGTPGAANCVGQSTSALAQQYGGLADAATAFGFSGVPALQDSIKSFCAASPAS